MDKRLFDKKYFLWRSITFAGYITPAQFWSEIAIRLISFFCAVIILCMVLSAKMTGDSAEIVAMANKLVPILALLWLIPIAALTRRRLRDAGYSAKSYLWLLLPIVGWIVFVIRLCTKTAKRKPEEIWFEYNT